MDTTTEVKPVPVSDPEKPGLKSSEGKFSAISMASGASAVLAGLITTLTQLQADNPEIKWVGLFISILGVIQMMFTQMTNTTKRTDLKLKQIELRKVEAQATAQIASAQALAAAAASKVATQAAETAMAKMDETIKPATGAAAEIAAGIADVLSGAKPRP